MSVPRPAASLIVVRPGASGPEILLLERNSRARFMPGAYVFPGGAVDAADRTGIAFQQCRQPDDREASRLLSVSSMGLSFFIAAIRECFEECGLLLAVDGAGNAIDLGAWTEAQLLELRAQCVDARIGLSGICQRRGWRLATDALTYYSHWVTPADLPLRFDAHFFVARAPGRQRPLLVGHEMTNLIWCDCKDALARSARGELCIHAPTSVMLQELARYRDTDSLLRDLQSTRSIVAR
jgi:8-oxo-dGTP pyrophosphatase MutT (NUDIX family)